MAAMESQSNIIETPSPNHDSRDSRPDIQGGGAVVDMLIFHYTGMQNAEAALARLCDPQAKVSAHYLVDEEGRVHGLVPEDRRAWHAGVAHWAGQDDINSCSIGIELVNPGHEFGYHSYSVVQSEAALGLARGILSRHGIPRHRVLAHSDVAPARKLDPGEFFPWPRFAWQGVGLWPSLDFKVSGRSAALRPGMAGPEVSAMRRDLQAFGYGLAKGELYDEVTQIVVTAFQRHWRPARIDGVYDHETRVILSHFLGRLL